MREPFKEFLQDLRDGLDADENGVTWQEWLDRAKKNFVALTIIFCFVVMTGSCVLVPIISITRSDPQSSVPTATQEASPRNPWAID